ncbi:MAG TPA: cell division protein FtsZ [Stellaceae bacterium]|jgi:cell division protein FtsZ|nr:cell division protein FtsZ [Stellaceae bacterium]
MTLNLTLPEEEQELAPRITVIGVGGAGGNAVNNMIRSNLAGVEFVICNTDAQAMKQNLCERRIQMGIGVTRGLGAGSRPEVGRAAAEEALEEIMIALEGSNMAFITAGMGGGTGTGAAPVIARAARESGILTIGVVTKPFQFEGTHRMRLAEAGILELQKYVDTLIIIPNQNLFRVANERTTFADAFKMADDVLHSGVAGVTDLMVKPGLINLDFADIRAVMSEMGKAMMGTGEAEGDRRAIDAAEAAISNPLLEDVSMKGARGVLINITGGPDMTLFEVDEAANRIREEVDPDANIIFGSTFDDRLEGRMRISVVATGIEVDKAVQPRPLISLVSDRSKTDGARPALASFSSSPSPAAELKPLEQRLAETRSILEPRPAAEPRFNIDARAEAKAEPAAIVPQAQSIEAQAVRSGVFIPPKPIEAAAKPVVAPVPAPAPDAMATAAIENGGRPQQKPSRVPSLFERVTKAGRLLHREEPEPPVARAAPVAAAAPAPVAAPAPAPAPAPTPTPAPAAQAKLGPLDPTERPGAKEEDLLDIPAFLRRQAN